MSDPVKNSKAFFGESEFEKLFKSQFKELCFFAQLYIKDIDTAKEIVQEVFISLWEKRDSIEEGKSIITYLKSSIANKSINYLRDNKKFDKEILRFENLYPEAGNSVSDILVVDELRILIDDAINELPDKCKEIFLLNRFGNLKYKEISIKLDITLKTVEGQMAKALQHMRNKLIHYIGILIIMINLKNF